MVPARHGADVLVSHAGRTELHVLPEHAVPVGQMSPHPPQFEESDTKSASTRHVPSQQVPNVPSGKGHVEGTVALERAWPHVKHHTRAFDRALETMSQ